MPGLIINLSLSSPMSSESIFQQYTRANPTLIWRESNIPDAHTLTYIHISKTRPSICGLKLSHFRSFFIQVPVINQGRKQGD